MDKNEEFQHLEEMIANKVSVSRRYIIVSFRTSSSLKAPACCRKIALLFGEELEGKEVFKVLASCSNKVSLLNCSDFGVIVIIAPDYLLISYHNGYGKTLSTGKKL